MASTPQPFETLTDRTYTRMSNDRPLKVYRKTISLGIPADDEGYLQEAAHGIDRVVPDYLKVVNCWQYVPGVDRPDADAGQKLFGTRQITPESIWITPSTILLQMPAGLVIADQIFLSPAVGIVFVEIEYAKEEIDMYLQPADGAAMPYISWIPGTLENPILLNNVDSFEFPVYVQVEQGDTLLSLDPVADDGGVSANCAFAQGYDENKFGVIVNNLSDASMTHPTRIGIQTLTTNGRVSRRYFYVQFVAAE